MQIKGNYRYRFISMFLMFALIISVMAGCSTKKEDSDGTSDNGTEVTDNAETTKTKTPPKMKTLPLDTVLLTVDDKQYTLADFMYLIYSMEQSINESVEVQNGLDYWNDIINETTNETGREQALDQLMNQSKQFVIMKQLAEKSGFKLSDEVKADVEISVQSVLENMDEQHKERTGFTKENLTKLITDYYFVESYYNAEIERQKVDEAKIKQSISYEDYKQRQVEYVFVETVITNTNGDKQEKTAEEVAELVKSANQILNKAKEGSDLQTAYKAIVPAGNADIIYDNQVVTDGDIDSYPSAFFRAAESLKEGQVYDRLVETEGGYYIIRLVNDKATSLYDDAVQEAIKQAKQDSYEVELGKIYEEHSIIENEEEWQKIVLGEYAYTMNEEPEQNDSDKFETNDSNSQGNTVLPADAANEDDGSVG